LEVLQHCLNHVNIWANRHFPIDFANFAQNNLIVGGIMLPLVCRKDCYAYARRLRWRGGRGDNRKFAHSLAVIAAVGVACGVMSFGAVARADGVEGRGDPIAALRTYVQLVATAPSHAIAAEDTDQASTGVSRGELAEDAYAALRAFVQQITVDRPQLIKDGPKLAEADNAFDALREFLRRQNGSAPPEQPKMTPPPAARPTAPITEAPIVAATPVGSKVCLGCHASQADTFSHTLMGRLATQGKLQCENCHGPGSAHLQAVGCAACHGDGGISKRAGIPSLAGQDPQYLLTAMKAYISGQRKHELMRALLSHVGEAELNKIALYYARQPPARAQTPPVGNPQAGKAAAASCAGCHGEQGISVSPAFPNLAGQDAQYLADAIRAYKHGSREKVIACAACHGEGGISKSPGIPSLVGQDPQYLVSAMKAYVAGQRKNTLMKALLSGVGEAELNNFALYYGQQIPARAPTPLVGDPLAGKTASALCAGCHGEQGVSVNPAWPSLAGQDAQYLADAIKSYRDGSRSNETMKAIVASVDERTINDIVSYFASLPPSRPSRGNNTQNAPAKRAPVLVRNGLVAALDERTINNVASYYASLHPAQPSSAKNAPAKDEPILVRKAAPVDGRSVGGIISFRTDDPGRTVEDNNAICLRCHERGDRTYWNGSVHEMRGLACTNCHTVMRSVSAKYQLKTVFQPDTCFQCHKDRRAQMFRSSHMPVREGKVVCSDCHNPHGSHTEAMLRGDSINDTCYKCHAEKRGPFLFEHAPVRENCGLCHDPHGSVNEFLLRISRPRLCAECHGLGHTGFLQGGPFQIGAFSRSCQNCHTQIHGTNSPAGVLRHR